MISRKTGERILITLDPDVDPGMSAGALFAHGPIEIVVAATGPTTARIALALPPALRADRLGRKPPAP